MRSICRIAARLCQLRCTRYLQRLRNIAAQVRCCSTVARLCQLRECIVSIVRQWLVQCQSCNRQSLTALTSYAAPLPMHSLIVSSFARICQPVPANSNGGSNF